MGKTLIIAEKPSVASDIAKALGKFQKQDDYFENDDYVISSAVGHLLTIVPPEGVEAVRGKWTFKCLPVIPPHFDLQAHREERKPPQGARQAHQAQGRGQAHQRLRRRARRRIDLPQHRPLHEGQAAHPAALVAIHDARRHPRGLRRVAHGCESMQPLSDAATSRSEADWLVGINGTRAMTAFNSKLGGFFKTTVGSRADADAGDSRRARGKDPEVRAARFLGNHRDVRRQGRAIRRALV
jgi:DNA topoisomerase-3